MEGEGGENSLGGVIRQAAGAWLGIGVKGIAQGGGRFCAEMFDQANRGAVARVIQTQRDSRGAVVLAVPGLREGIARA